MAIVLVIAAHFDDEVLGCGGTLAKHVAQHDQVFECVLTDSSSTQYAEQPEKHEQKRREWEAAGRVLGVTRTFCLNLPDMRLDTVPHHRVNDALQDVVREVNPRLVYTHFWGDINRDHTIAFHSTLVALRPVAGRQATIYSYEVPSSTEWGPPGTPFQPNSYSDVTGFLETKLRAMGCYATELREYPHPRSLQAIEHLARKRGSEVSLPAAEAFILVREIR